MLFAGCNREPVKRSRFRPSTFWIHRGGARMHHIVVERVLHVRRPIRKLVQSFAVRFVLGEDQLRLAVTREVVPPERFVLGEDLHGSVARLKHRQRWAIPAQAPAPGVAKPERRQHVDRRRLWTAIRNGDSNEKIRGRALRVLDRDVEITVLGEYASVDQLELWIALAAPSILLDQLL